MMSATGVKEFEVADDISLTLIIRSLVIVSILPNHKN